MELQITLLIVVIHIIAFAVRPVGTKDVCSSDGGKYKYCDSGYFCCGGDNCCSIRAFVFIGLGGFVVFILLLVGFCALISKLTKKCRKVDPVQTVNGDWATSYINIIFALSPVRPPATPLPLRPPAYTSQPLPDPSRLY